MQAVYVRHACCRQLHARATHVIASQPALDHLSRPPRPPCSPSPPPHQVGTGSIAGLWVAPALLHLVIGFAMALVVLPLTRIYEPLERTTGFSFGYAAGYGILGGISPIVVTAFKARLPPHLKAIAPAICERPRGARGVWGVGCSSPRSPSAAQAGRGARPTQLPCLHARV